MIEHLFNTTCEKISTKTNDFGDVVYDNNATEYSCRFQHKLGIQYQNNAELEGTDALAWFSIDADVKQGDILKFEDGFYRVLKFVKGLGRTDVKFLKCALEKHKVLHGA